MPRVPSPVSPSLVSTASLAALLSLSACSSTDSAAAPGGSKEQMDTDAASAVVFPADATEVVITHLPDLAFGAVDGGNCTSLKAEYTFDVAAGTLAYSFCPTTGTHLAELQTGSFLLPAPDRANVVARLQAVTVLPASTAMCVPDGELETADVTAGGAVAHYVDEMGACAETRAPGATPTTGLDALSALLFDLADAHSEVPSDAGAAGSDGGT